MTKASAVLALSATLVLGLAAHVGAETYAYPSKGQSTKQQQRDKQECQAWATKQTGFDPSKAAAPREGANAGGGAAGGAALGAARGATEGAAGEGAARGAVRGRLLGAIRRRRQEREQEAEAAGGEQGTRADYDRAYGGCMTGRGYTVE
jgi:hypothetical protein